MINLEYLKQFREIKDVADIVDEVEKLDCLTYQNDWDAVGQHLKDVSKKHSAEKAVYNSVNQVAPQSLQQSAANCRQFLLLLGAEKLTKELSEHLGRN